MTHYNVLQLSDRKMILEVIKTFQDWGVTILQMKECWKSIRQYPKPKILLLIGDRIQIIIL